MKAKEIQALESYFKTDNEYWNGYIFKMLCEVLKQGDFEAPEVPLQLFSKSVDIFLDEYKTPLKALQTFGNEAGKHNLNSNQMLFVYEQVYHYLKNSEFEDIETNEIKELLKNKVECLKAEVNKPLHNKPLVGGIRETLKDLMKKEFEQLPETLKGLDPVQRLNILCKLIPYVLPKVEAVHSEKGEPETGNKTSITGFQW